ncbi:MAG: DedA family protein, partial [Verrucomicrobia bacterium]|nr:DedA family protein [Verrucomicrobiota bacterium]
WIEHYGVFALFGLLALGIIALPIPDESLMVVAGVLMFEGSLAIPHTLLACYLGTMTGITVSYFLGRTLGKYVIHRFGGWVGITPEMLKNSYTWFRHYGTWTLLFGYFIPGIRHLTGIIAGSIALEYPLFALFAYIGAILWASTFMALGYFFGNYWLSVLEWVEIYIDEIMIAAILALVGYLIYRVRGK